MAPVKKNLFAKSYDAMILVRFSKGGRGLVSVAQSSDRNWMLQQCNKEWLQPPRPKGSLLMKTIALPKADAKY